MNDKISVNNKRTWMDVNVREKRIKGILAKCYGELTPAEYYNNNIRIFVLKEKTVPEIAKICNKSIPTIRKCIKLYGTQDEWNFSRENGRNKMALSGSKKKGKGTPFKGKTYREILGSVESAVKRSKITSDWMKQRNIRRFATKISKPQKMLFDIIKSFFPCAQLEFEIKVENRRSIWLDIALVNEKINFEYDGMHWHNKNNQHNTTKSKFTDEQRDQYLQRLGWRIFRFCYTNNPTRAVLEEDVKNKLKGLI